MEHSLSLKDKLFKLVFLAQETSPIKEICDNLITAMFHREMDVIDIMCNEITFSYKTLPNFINKIESLTEDELKLLKSFSLINQNRQVNQKVDPKSYTQLARYFLNGLGIESYLLKFNQVSIFQLHSDSIFDIYIRVTSQPSP